MPRATLTFRLPAEADEFQVAADGWKWRGVARDLDELLRQWGKYGTAPRGVESAGPAHGIRDELRRLLDESGLTLDE